MASIPASSDKLTGSSGRLDMHRVPAAAELGPVEPPLFRFGLRQLLYFVAAVSLLLTATVLSHGMAALAMLLAVLVVAAHLFSTALATRLRSRTDQEQSTRRNGTVPFDGRELSSHADKATPIPPAVRSPWHSRGSTSLPWLRWLVVAGTVAGGGLGAATLSVAIGHRLTPVGILVGGISSAVLGGWFAFLAGSFYGILRHGIREAVAEQRKDERKRALVS